MRRDTHSKGPQSRRMRAVISLLLVHAWTPCLSSVIINTPYEAIQSYNYGKNQYYTNEKVAESHKIKNSGLKTINGTSSSDHQNVYDPNDKRNTRSSDHQSDYKSNNFNDASSNSSDHQSEHESNEIVKDADLTVFINLDDNLYDDNTNNETTSIELMTSITNDAIGSIKNSQSDNNFNSLNRNETSQSKPVKDESLKESTRSEISSHKYQVTYVPVKYYSTVTTVPVPHKTFDLSINSETSFNNFFLSRFQLQFSRAPPLDNIIINNNENGNINYYNSYIANNRFKVPSLLRIPAIVADRIKKKGAAFFGGVAGLYKA